VDGEILSLSLSHLYYYPMWLVSLGQGRKTFSIIENRKNEK
jgi:hypothetical protein